MVPPARYGPRGDGAPDTPPYGITPVDGPAEYGPPPSVSPPPPPRPDRGGRIAAVMLAVLLVALAVGSFFALRETTDPRTRVPPAVAAAPSESSVSAPAPPGAETDTPAPGGDPAPPGAAEPTEVPVDQVADGQIGPGIYRIGTKAGQVQGGVWVSDGPSQPGLPCYAEVFRRGPADDVIGEPVPGVRVAESGGGSLKITVPARGVFFATTGCQPWRRA